MKLQYLGTASAEGWPSLFCNCKQCETARLLGRRNIRTRAQAVLYAEAVGTGSPDDILLIDLPPDTYMHVLHHGLRLDRIGHMLITYSYPGKFTPGELSYRYGAFANPMPNFTFNVYGNEATEVRYKNEVTYRPESGIEYHVVESFRPFEAGVFTVTPLPAFHDKNEECFIYMIEHSGKRMLYAHDTGIFPKETFEYISGKFFDLVSLDCTYCTTSEGVYHMGLPDAENVKRRMDAIGCLKPKTKIVLNHFSHTNGTCYDALNEIAAEHDMEVSYDGGVWDI
ncbi:MAG: MBL fold metallo-hydrolase [Defluviitaleaceae bacterium]|nr:MBL fold metallo-hydrolase [Defluviitaleaceae bacterium]